MMATMALWEYLRTAKQAWTELRREYGVITFTTSKLINVVVGNQACDADSVMSAITLAFLEHSRAHSDTLSMHVPFVSCNKVDFNLRREAAYLLDESRRSLCAASGDTNALEDNLLFLDDLDPSFLLRLKEHSKLMITLTDHNKLDGTLSSIAGLDACVYSIIDHHKDARAHPQVHGANRKISFDELIGKGVGSTCTLVAQEFLAQAATLTAPGGADTPTTRTPLDASIAKMLCGVILLDTVNMDPAAGKGTPDDAAVIEQLANVVQQQTSAPLDTTALFHTLSSLREDASWWRSLSTTQVLGYDYKAFDMPLSSAEATSHHRAIKVGIASMGIHITDFLGSAEEAGASSDSGAPFTVCATKLAEINGFIEASGIDLLVMMSRASGRRQLAVVLPSGGREFSLDSCGALCAALECDGLLDLHPAATTVSSDQLVKVYYQGNFKASRKQFVPLMEDVLKGFKC